MSHQRRYDLDWLRVIAFGLLIYFHTAIAFLPSPIPMMSNAESSVGMRIFVNFLQEFRLGLLFLVAGAGVWFALKQRSQRAFFSERSQRLLIPLAFGILVLVPPMVFLERLFNQQFDGTLWQFYSVFFTQGVYPHGHLSWHHFWFIAYLYLFCLIGWPVLNHLRRREGEPLLHRVSRHLGRGLGIYLPIIPLILLELPLRVWFPGFRDLIHDWASFSHWFLLFLLGAMWARDSHLLARAESLRHLSLCVALVASASLFIWFWPKPQGHFTPQIDPGSGWFDYVVFCVVRMVNAWCWLLSCMGYAARYLNHPSQTLRYLNTAVFPLFCVHLPLIVLFDYWVLPLDWPISIKFITITSATIISAWAVYHWLLQPYPKLGLLCGLKPNEHSKAIA